MALRRKVLIIGALATVVVTAACHSGGSSRAASSSPAPSPSSAVSSPGPADAALDAYRHEWAASQQAALTADYQSAAVRQFARDKGLAYFVGALYDDSRQGYIAKGTVKTNPQATSVSATTVQVTDCLDDTQWLVYRASDGQLKNNVPGGHHHVDATVTLDSGAWVISDITVQGVGTC